MISHTKIRLAHLCDFIHNNVRKRKEKKEKLHL